MEQMKPSARGIDAIISLNGVPLGGQKNIVFNRNATTIDISNEIKKDWTSIIPSKKNWTVICSGVVIKDSESFNALEGSFLMSTPIDVELKGSGRNYSGSAYIISFPLSATYNDTFTYNLTLMGTGELTVE